MMSNRVNQQSWAPVPQEPSRGTLQPQDAGRYFVQGQQLPPVLYLKGSHKPWVIGFQPKSRATSRPEMQRTDDQNASKLLNIRWVSAMKLLAALVVQQTHAIAL